MRDKKYRAWDNVVDRYLYSDKFPSTWQFFKELENRGIRHWETEDYINKYDKYNNKIYEGDIVVLTNPRYQIQKKRLLGVVIFSFSAFGVEIKSADVWEGYHEGIEPSTIVWFLSIDDPSTVEVIGTIHENPELLV